MLRCLWDINPFQVFNCKLWQLRHSDWFLMLQLNFGCRRGDCAEGLDVFVEIYISFYFNASHDSKPLPMSIIEDSPLSVETPAISAHDTSTQPNTTHHMGNSVLGVEGIALTRRYVTKWGCRNYKRGSLLIVASRIIQDVIKPAIKTFLETCDTNPRIAVWILLSFLRCSWLVFLGLEDSGCNTCDIRIPSCSRILVGLFSVYITVLKRLTWFLGLC